MTAPREGGGRHHLPPLRRPVQFWRAGGRGRTGVARAPTRDQRRVLREEARDEDAIRTFAGFVRRFWSIVEPARPLVWNWHYQVICDELERVARGEVRELVICVPPGTGKSILVSAMFPAWLWLHHGHQRVMALSHNPRPVVRDAIRMRNIVRSPKYRDLLEVVSARSGMDGACWTMAPDQDEKVNFQNSLAGVRLCSTMGGAVTGDRVDGIIVDDPYDVKQALLGSPIQIADRMGEAITIYDDVLASRIDPIVGWRIVIMQRVHEGDLAGELLRRGVHSIVFPMEWEPNAKYPHPDDPRITPGELLFEKRYSREWCENEKKTPTGARKWQSQYQQEPAPTLGSLFLRQWFGQRYSGDPVRFARSMPEQAITVDCTFKDGRKVDYVVMQVWGRDGTRKYLLDQVRARMDLPGTLHALMDLVQKWPMARAKLVEAAANGPGVMQILEKQVHGLIPVNPQGGKYARAQVAAIAFEAGEVYLPKPEFAPWIGDYVEEMTGFPHAPNDDQVDATSQLFQRWDGPESTNATLRTKNQFEFLLKR